MDSEIIGEDMMCREIGILITKILENANDRPDSIMFLLFLAAIDKSKKIFKFLKSRTKKIYEILRKLDAKILSLKRLGSVLMNSDTSILLDSDDVIEKATLHCILLRSIPCLKFIFESGNKNNINISINISTVSTLILEHDCPVIQKIIKFFLNKNVLLSFATKRNKKLERLSSDFKIHSSNSVSRASGNFYEETERDRKNSNM